MKPKSIRRRRCRGSASVAPGANAQITDDWQFRAILYGYFPDIGGSTSFPAGSTGGNIDVNASTIIDSLKFTFMGLSRHARDAGAAWSISCTSTSAVPNRRRET